MIPYSLHVAIILSVSLGFYKLLLERQTYYRLNRLVLLGCLLLSFTLPLIRVPQRFSLLNTPVTVQPVSASGPGPAENIKQFNPLALEALNRQSIMQWAVWIYWFGVAAFGCIFLLQALMLLYQSHKSESIQDGRYKIVELETNKAPCSFGRFIFINPAKYDWDTYNRILIHEKIHVREHHSIDLALAELMLVFQWFNPLAWIYRKTVESNAKKCCLRLMISAI
jgi:hypothetical protein